MSVRSCAKAIIVHNGRLLMNRCHDSQNGDYCTLPGGGQNQYETLADTVVRECLEETGYTVVPIRFAALHEEILDDEAFRQRYPEYVHRIYHIFLCKLCNVEGNPPSEMDAFQTGCEWINISDLQSVKILPEALGRNIEGIIQGNGPTFLGSEHISVNHG